MLSFVDTPAGLLFITFTVLPREKRNPHRVNLFRQKDQYPGVIYALEDRIKFRDGEDVQGASSMYVILNSPDTVKNGE